MPRDRRQTRDIHVLDEDGMVACNPRDREAAHRASVGDIAVAEPDGVTCRRCLEVVYKKENRRLKMGEQVIEIEAPFFDPEPNIAEPTVVQSERACYLIYWDREMKRKTLEFSRCSIATFGYPNDSALAGHPLYSKGLGYYGFFEVLESEWIHELRRRNAVRFPEFAAFAEQRHFVVTFHDSTFECIASGFHAVDEFPVLDSKLVRLEESL